MVVQYWQRWKRTLVRQGPPTRMPTTPPLISQREEHEDDIHPPCANDEQDRVDVGRRRSLLRRKQPQHLVHLMLH